MATLWLEKMARVHFCDCMTKFRPKNYIVVVVSKAVLSAITVVVVQAALTALAVGLSALVVCSCISGTIGPSWSTHLSSIIAEVVMMFTFITEI